MSTNLYLSEKSRLRRANQDNLHSCLTWWHVESSCARLLASRNSPMTTKTSSGRRQKGGSSSESFIVWFFRHSLRFFLAKLHLLMAAFPLEFSKPLCFFPFSFHRPRVRRHEAHKFPRSSNETPKQFFTLGKSFTETLNQREEERQQQTLHFLKTMVHMKPEPCSKNFCLHFARRSHRHILSRQSLARKSGGRYGTRNIARACFIIR